MKARAMLSAPPLQSKITWLTKFWPRKKTEHWSAHLMAPNTNSENGGFNQQRPTMREGTTATLTKCLRSMPPNKGLPFIEMYLLGRTWFYAKLKFPAGISPTISENLRSVAFESYMKSSRFAWIENRPLCDVIWDQQLLASRTRECSPPETA